MIARLLEHVRSNVIAYLALILSLLALSGGAYAAWIVPPHSVGALQIRNHSVGAAKLDPQTIGGSIRHWAQVAAPGNIVSSSSRAHDTGIPRDGDYLINWSDTFSSRCVPIATVIGTGGAPQPGSWIRKRAHRQRTPDPRVGQHLQPPGRSDPGAVLDRDRLLTGAS